MDDHGVVLAVGTSTDDIASRLRAGEVLSQIVLDGNRDGDGKHPHRAS